MHFGLLTVTPEYRGSGLAPAIINAIEAYGRALQCRFVQLDYMSVAPWLKSYYEKFGFRETGVKEPWANMDLIQMSKGLN